MKSWLINFNDRNHPRKRLSREPTTLASATLAAHLILGNSHSVTPSSLFFSFLLGTQLVGIKHDRDALNVLYAHRRSHTRTHASRELSGRRTRGEKRRRQRAVKKKTSVEREISREGGGQKEGEKRERWREKEERLRWSTWKLPVVVVVYERHTGVTRTLACVRGGSSHAHAAMYILYARSTRERTAITLVWRRSRARARERGQIEPRVEWGKRRVCGATRIHVYTHTQHACGHTYVHVNAYARRRPGTARAKLTLTWQDVSSETGRCHFCTVQYKTPNRKVRPKISRRAQQHLRSQHRSGTKWLFVAVVVVWSYGIGGRGVGRKRKREEDSSATSRLRWWKVEKLEVEEEETGGGGGGGGRRRRRGWRRRRRGRGRTENEVDGEGGGAITKWPEIRENVPRHGEWRCQGIEKSASVARVDVDETLKEDRRDEDFLFHRA